MPAMGFDTDDGFGLGARLELDWYKEHYDPYSAALVIHGYASTNGYHHHRVRFDLPGLGKRHNLRLFGHFAYRQWLNDGYWGVGNGTVVERRYTDLPSDDPDYRHYRYTLIQPFGRLTLRAEIGGPWAAFAFYGARWSRVEADAGSLLAVEQPIGMDGGFGMQIGGGLLYDTREPELTPDSGMLIELAARAAPPLPGAEGQWWAPFASIRGFRTLGPGVVLGSRLMGEYMVGEVPFYDLITWGGLVPYVGMGGSETIRGTNFGRWRAPGKALWNTELRVDIGTHQAFHREVRWQAVPFFDAGMLWGAGPDGDFPFHPGVGFGFHPIVEKTFAGRFDAAMGMETVREEDGDITWEPNFGGYVVFEHLF
jgi:outer membrane protein assembly factor BamA